MHLDPQLLWHAKAAQIQHLSLYAARQNSQRAFNLRGYRAYVHLASAQKYVSVSREKNVLEIKIVVSSANNTIMHVTV